MARTLIDVAAGLARGESTTISCYGDSLTYGQDEVSPSRQWPTNGAEQARSPTPFPETMAAVLAARPGTSICVHNRGYPGDNAASGLARWADDEPCDLAILMYGVNDANNLGGLGLVSVEDYRANMTTMIERSLARGGAVALMLSPRFPARALNAALVPFSQALCSLGRAFGLPILESAVFLSGIALDEQTVDGVHLAPHAYARIGEALAALLVKARTSPTTVAATL